MTTLERHVPDEESQAFERLVGELVADQPCAWCRNRLGPGPRRQNHGQFHPSCWKRAKREGFR